jgi:hypothetical protein
MLQSPRVFEADKTPQVENSIIDLIGQVLLKTQALNL